MRVAVVQFPGSNCDEDTVRAAQNAGAEAYLIWHREPDLQGPDAVMIPGGFAYGDYLRAGAIARFSPVMNSVIDFAEAGGPVLGICNGFQVLCEAGLLPGALMRNRDERFLSRPVQIRLENADTQFTTAYQEGFIFTVPIAHGEGRYVASESAVTQLESEGLVVLRYVAENPNGSVNGIAGVCNRGGNVVGMMPHPERATSSVLGNNAGAGVFDSIMQGVELTQGSTR